MEYGNQQRHLEHNLKDKESLEEMATTLRRKNISNKVEDDKQLRNCIRVTLTTRVT